MPTCTLLHVISCRVLSFLYILEGTHERYAWMLTCMLHPSLCLGQPCKSMLKGSRSDQPDCSCCRVPCTTTGTRALSCTTANLSQIALAPKRHIAPCGVVWSYAHGDISLPQQLEGRGGCASKDGGVLGSFFAPLLFYLGFLYLRVHEPIIPPLGLSC